MFPPWAFINKCHPDTPLCAQRAEKKFRILSEEEARDGVAQKFTEYVCTMLMVSSFRYLRNKLTETDDDWTAVVSNLRKSLQQWERLSMILGRNGADARTSGRFYMAVVQVTLLFGSDMWVLNPHLVQTFGMSLHHVVQYLTGNLPQRRTYRVFYNTPSGRCSEGGGSGGYDGLHSAETEYGRSVYCYASDYGYMIGVGGTSKGTGGKVVAVTRRYGINESTGGIRGGKDGRCGRQGEILAIADVEGRIQRSKKNRYKA